MTEPFSTAIGKRGAMESIYLMSRLPILVAISAAILSCDRNADPQPTPRESPNEYCSMRHRQDPARAVRIRELLATTEAGRDLIRRAPEPPRICFANIPVAAVTTEGIFLLDPETPDAESAARLGHLLHHRVEGGPRPDVIDPSRPCEEVLGEAIMSEARAHALELQLRRDLEVTNPIHTFPFEQEFWAAPPGERVEVLRAYFLAHPDGEIGVPAFVRAYGRDCTGSLDRREEK